MSMGILSHPIVEVEGIAYTEQKLSYIVANKVVCGTKIHPQTVLGDINNILWISLINENKRKGS